MNPASLVTLLGLAVTAGEPADCPRYFTESHRGVSMSAGASRETPAIEIAYGPRAQLLLGAERGLVDAGDTSVGLSMLLGLDNVASYSPLPGEAWRQQTELAVRHTVLRYDEDGQLEVLVGVGYAASRLTRGAPVAGLHDPTDIPFGGGGLYIALELAARWPLGGAWTLDGRLRHRWFTNAWPALFDEEESAFAVAGVLEEGLAHAPEVDLVLRWQGTETAAVIVALNATALIPSDPVADLGYRVRMLAGAEVGGEVARILPFGALEVGNGYGVVIARRELRLTLGVRLVL